MKKKELILICSYIYNNLQELEYEVHVLQSNLRHRKIDVSDCVELMLAEQRLETFKEVTGHIRTLLKIGGNENE